MSGFLHSLVGGFPDADYLTLLRGSSDVSVVLVKPPKDPYVRTVGGGPVLDPAAVRVANVGTGTAEVEFYVDTPFGSFLADAVTVGAGVDTTRFLPTLTEGQTLRAVLLATSGAGAEVDLTPMWSDIDTLKHVDHELQTEYADVLTAGDEKMIVNYQTGGYLRFMAQAGADLNVEFRVVDADGTLHALGSELITAGLFAAREIPYWLSPGQTLQARRTAGLGALSLLYIEQGYFFE